MVVVNALTLFLGQCRQKKSMRILIILEPNNNWSEGSIFDLCVQAAHALGPQHFWPLELWMHPKNPSRIRGTMQSSHNANPLTQRLPALLINMVVGGILSARVWKLDRELTFFPHPSIFILCLFQSHTCLHATKLCQHDSRSGGESKSQILQCFV